MACTDSAFTDIVLFPLPILGETEEFACGMQELRRRLPQRCRWYMPTAAASLTRDTALAMTESPWILFILNPALIISDNFLTELLAVAEASNAHCVLPADPRGFTAGVPLDYASRAGFDRFVNRLQAGPRWSEYDGRVPWVFLVARAALEKADDAVAWPSLPVSLGMRSVISQHVFVHSYADYHANTRAEMLRLIPTDVRSLLDVGGGAGNFARTFMAQRGGRAAVLEANPQAAEMARAHGVDVLTGDFGVVTPTELFDCVAMLDVLEHMSDPLTALKRAHQFLQPSGTLLLSLPNIGHWSVVWDLLEGKFDYQPVGILCNTHLRFFTRHGLLNLLGDAGFSVERWEDVASPPPACFTKFLAAASIKAADTGDSADQGVSPDLQSLSTESFHVFARRTG